MIIALILSQFASAAPATVLDHSLTVGIDYRRRLTSTQSWTVRIDDPSEVAAGLFAPPGLDGAADGGALVLEGLLVLPQDVAAGDTFTLVATGSGPRSSHAGVFATAIGLPTLAAEVQVTTPRSESLTVWADPGADREWSTGRTKSAVLRWSDLDDDQRGEIVWSTWKDWDEVGEQLTADTADRMATKSQLGRRLASDLGSSNLTELARRAFDAIEVIPGDTGSFQEARSAAEVAAAGSGTAAERGLVLIALLRAAGYDASAALYRAADAGGTFPITVPGPALLDRPLVRAESNNGKVLFVDPANDVVAIPTLPRRLLGATVWIPGDLPTRLFNRGALDGSVDIQTFIQIQGDGSVTWTSDIVAQGVATEALRSRLGTLDQADREGALGRLVRQGRPGLERFAVTSSGTEDPYRQLKLSLSGQEDAVFVPFGPGVRGDVKPVIGPAMTAWLPPNIQVREFVDLKGPGGTRLLAVQGAKNDVHPDALVQRTVSRNGPRASVEFASLRPYTVTTSERDANASIWLEEIAERSVRTIWTPTSAGSSAKALRGAGTTPAEGAALEAMAWWAAANDKKARKVLKKALKSSPPDEIIAALQQWEGGTDGRAWTALFALADEDATAQLGAVKAAATARDAQTAVELANAMSQAEPGVRAAAWLAVLPAAPEPAAAALGGMRDAIPAELRSAVATGLAVHAGATDLSDVGNELPIELALHLRADAATSPRETLRGRAVDLMESHPQNADLHAVVSEALASGRQYADSLAAALTAARLTPDRASSWAGVAERALQAGELTLALDAARQASDLAPEDSAMAAQLQYVATLAIDTELEQLARDRAPGESLTTWPPTVEDLLGVAQPSSLLAVLQHHDAVVTQSPMLLGLRAQLRTDAGLLDEAARDGIVLSSRHRDPAGDALAFAATVGRVDGQATLSLLDDPRDEISRLTRMDYRTITASGDPRIDARILRDQPRAADILEAAGAPGQLAERDPDWVALDRFPRRVPTPRGYRLNSLLSGVSGVTGFSQSDRQLALLHVNGDVQQLPPPLSVLYRVVSPPIASGTSTLVRLSDGYVPLYAARASEEGVTWWGLGFTPQAALRALADRPSP